MELTFEEICNEIGITISDAADLQEQAEYEDWESDNG